MLVEDTASLKEWVITELTRDNIDADPNAVAMYTVALVKKGPNTEEELRPSICENLSVFLTENTESFVMRLFSVLEDKSYLQRVVSVEEASTNLSSGTQDISESAVSRQDSAVSRQDSAVSRPESRPQDTEDELSDDDRDHRRTIRRSRSRSLSPPNQPNRPRISPHRRIGYNRGGHRGGGGGGGGGGGYPPRGMGRGNARSRLGRAGYHNNDYGGFNNRRYVNNGSGPLPRRRSRSPRHSLSPVPRRRSRSPRRSLSPRRSPIHRSRSPLDLLATLDVVKSSPNKQNHNRQRCQDYDVQGFCLKGELCAFSHGNDAVVMTDVSGLKFNSTSSAGPSSAPVNSVPPPVIPNQQTVPIRSVVPRMPAPAVEPYNPEVPRMWAPQMNRAMRPPQQPRGAGYMIPHPGAPMGNFTNMPHGHHPGGGPGGPGMRHMGPGPGPRQMFRPRYQGHSQQRPGVSHPPIKDPNRATLEIRNLPVESNKIVTLHEHFEKFGTIHNLQVRYNGSPTTALVTFSTNEEAKRAHQNPAPLFNNRFIKLFWHNENNQAQDPTSTATQQPGTSNKAATKDKLDSDAAKANTSHPPKKARVEPNMNRASLRLDKSAQSRQLPQTSRIDQRKQLDQQRQTILMKLIEQQKRLILKAEKTKDPKLKAEILKELKKQGVSIKEMKESLESSQAITKSKDSAATRANKAFAKDLLDAEMDFHQRKLAGEDTADLQHKLEGLKQKAESMGLVDSRGRGGGRGGRGRGRGGYHQTPHQPPPAPTALTVLGFKPEEKDAVIAHFQQYGSVTNRDYCEGPLTSIVIEYSKANDAKVASVHGGKFGSKNLIMKWYKPATSAPAAPLAPVAPTASATAAPAVPLTKPTTTQSTPSAGSTAPVPVATAAASKRKPGKQSTPSVQEVTSAEADTDLLDNDALAEGYDDLLAADDGNEEGDIDEALLLGDEEYEEEDSDRKRVWLP